MRRGTTQVAHSNVNVANYGGGGGAGGVSGLEITLKQASPPSDKYDILSKIGEGTYGVVYLARSKSGSNPGLFAIKTFKTGKEGDGISPTAVREIMLLRELHHENIVHLDSVHINKAEGSLSLAFDYAEHDLYEMIKYHRDKCQGSAMDTYTVKSVMWQLLNGLACMHMNWMIHRDLKPSNILVMGEGPEAGRVKIADFGLARIFQGPLRPLSDNGVVVTIWYRAPELLLGCRHYTPAVDMWATGCIFAELLLLKPLMQGAEVKHPGNAFQADQLDKIFRLLGHPSTRPWAGLDHLHHWHDNTGGIRIKQPEQSANRLQEHMAEANVLKPGSPALDLLQALLTYDPAQRMTASEALQHPYFTNDGVRPGPNVFVQGGQGSKKSMCRYPTRLKPDAYKNLGHLARQYTSAGADSRKRKADNWP